MRRLAIALVPLFLFACDRQPASPEDGAAVGSDPVPLFEDVNPAGADRPTQGSTTQSHFVANGPNALLGWWLYDPQGEWTIYGYLEVSQGGTASDPQTRMFYVVEYCDWTTCYPLEGGDGLIPNGDFYGNGRQLHLSTTTTGNPDFNVWAGSGGQVSVEWKGNGVYTQHQSGTLEWTYRDACDANGCYSPYKYRRMGRWTAASATASGSVVGMVLPFIGDASIGTNHQVTIELYRWFPSR